MQKSVLHGCVSWHKEHDFFPPKIPLIFKSILILLKLNNKIRDRCVVNAVRPVISNACFKCFFAHGSAVAQKTAIK